MNFILSKSTCIKIRKFERDLNPWEILTVFLPVTEAHSLKLSTWQHECNGFWHLVHCSEKIWLSRMSEQSLLTMTFVL